MNDDNLYKYQIFIIIYAMPFGRDVLHVIGIDNK